MAIADLLRTFERDVDAEVEAILAAARSDAARVTQGAARDRSDRVATASRAFERERQAAAERELAAAGRDARIEVLAAREAMLARVREALAAELRVRAGDPGVRDALDRAARACAGDEPATVQATPSGPILELASGVRIDATLESLAARTWPRLACLALEKLR